MILIFVVMINFLNNSECTQLIANATLETDCQLNFPTTNTHAIVVLNIEYATDEHIKNCIFHEIYNLNYPVQIIKGDRTHSDLTKDIIRKIVSQEPNIVFTINKLSPYLLKHVILSDLLEVSVLSTVYIIITEDNPQFSCINNSMDLGLYNKVKVLANEFWHLYRVIDFIIMLPFLCPNFLIVSDGQEIGSEELYNRTFLMVKPENLPSVPNFPRSRGITLAKNYPLRANIFARFPTVIKECETIKYFYLNNLNASCFCGLDGIIMQDVINHFKFNVTVSGNKKCDTYGYMLDNGTFTGTLGCTIRNEIDLSFNSRFMVPYGDNDFEYLHYVSHDSVCVILKLPSHVPLWHFASSVFSIELWVLITSILSVVGWFMWILAKIGEKMGCGKSKRFLFYIVDSIISGFFGFSLTRNNNFKIFRGTCFMVAILISAMYQGHVNYMFTTTLSYAKVNTLEELEGMQLYTSPTMRALLQEPANPVQTKLLEEMHEWDDPIDGETFDYILKNPNTATLTRKTDAVLETQKFYKDKYGAPLLYTVDECFYTEYLSYISDKGFPFATHLHLFMEHLLEAGLPDVYYRWTQHSMRLSNAQEDTRPSPRATSKINMADERIAFGLLLTGYFVSIIVLLFEKWTVKKGGCLKKV